jgi:Domain of unknown function (DUF4124)
MDIEGQLLKPELRYRPSEIRTEVGEFEIFSMPEVWAVGCLAARTQRSTITRAIAFLSLILIPSLGSAAIYKCTAQDGGITYTDEPCPADTTTQHIDPAAPAWLNEASQTMNTSPAPPDAKSQSQPEILAILCANDEFKVWLKAQRHSLPERDVRTAKFIRLSTLCRRALHLPDVAASIREDTKARVWADLVKLPQPGFDRDQSLPTMF